MIAQNKKQIREYLRQSNIEPNRETTNNDTGDIAYFINEKKVAVWEYKTKRLSIL